jgi:dUTP pyrophosphatase
VFTVFGAAVYEPGTGRRDQVRRRRDAQRGGAGSQMSARDVALCATKPRGRAAAPSPRALRPRSDGPPYAAAVHVLIRRLDPHLPLPAAQHEDDAGYDLVAAKDVVLAPRGGRAAVPTGIAIAIPPGFAGFVQPRSGLALRHGVTCLNTPGLIDSGYRDEVRVVLVNTDPSEPFTVRRGDRIAQLVVQPVQLVEWREVDELDATDRNLGGFGSTGL